MIIYQGNAGQAFVEAEIQATRKVPVKLFKTNGVWYVIKN